MPKQQILNMARKAARDTAYFEELYQCLDHADTTYAMKASWIMANAVMINPEIAKALTDGILDKLSSASNSGVQRELLKLLTVIELPDNLEGKLLDLCFRFIGDSGTAVGVRHYAIKYIYDRLKKYPELSNEFALLLEAQLPVMTEAGKSQVNKILRRLGKNSKF